MTQPVGTSVVVTIVDYGVGNLMSVARAVEHLGGKTVFATAKSDLVTAERVILPGVGAFAAGMRGLQTGELEHGIMDYLRTGRPFFGICLGQQLLMQKSEESPGVTGLSAIEGTVVQIPARTTLGEPLNVPHIGWSKLELHEQVTEPYSSLLTEKYFYFVHSFYVKTHNHQVTQASVNYAGNNLAAVLRKDNILSTQFHPEKSGPQGLKILDHFIRKGVQ